MPIAIPAVPNATASSPIVTRSVPAIVASAPNTPIDARMAAANFGCAVVHASILSIIPASAPSIFSRIGNCVLPRSENSLFTL